MPRSAQLYTKLLDDLRQQVSESFFSGERLPPQRALANMHGVGQSTVHQALSALAREGLVRAQPQVGWIRTGSKVNAGGVGKKRLRALSIGAITRSNVDEVAEDSLGMYSALAGEALRRGHQFTWIPNSRYHHPTPGRGRPELNRIGWTRFDAAVLVDVQDPVTLSDPLLRRRPVISVDYDATAFGISSVCFDDREAGRKSARHLLDLGHRNFAATDESDDPGFPAEMTWLARQQGFEEEIRRQAASILPEWRLLTPRRDSGKFVKPWCQRFAQALRANRPRPTGLFFVPIDSVALIEELFLQGIRVPRDISIITAHLTQPRVANHSLRVTHVHLNLRILMHKVIEAIEELATHKQHQRRPRLCLAPVNLEPGDTTSAPNPG